MSEGFPFAGSFRLPGRPHRWYRVGVVGALYGVVVLLIVVGAGDGMRVTAAVFVIAVPFTVLVLGRTVLRARIRRRLARADVEPVAAWALGEALAGAGVRQLTVACVPGGGLGPRGAARAYRTGRSGVIMLNPALRRADPELVRFVIAHEAGHVARDDSLVGSLTVGCVAGLVEGCVITPAAGWLLIPALAGVVAGNWLRELGCDRIAADATGARSAAAFVGYLGRIDDHIRGRPHGRRWTRVRSLLTHPPTAVRRRVCPSVADGDGGSAADAVVGGVGTDRRRGGDHGAAEPVDAPGVQTGPVDGHLGPGERGGG